MRSDPITPELRWTVLHRDGGCVALGMGAPDGCRNRNGYVVPPGQLHDLELDHVRDHAAMGGKRAPSDPAHLVALCHHHHQGGWATRNRPLLRRYLGLVADRSTIRAANEALREYQHDTGKAQT